MARTKNIFEHLGKCIFDPEYMEPGKGNDAKYKLGEQHVLYMLDRTQAMFDYEELPETIPARNLEMMLQLNGNVFFTQHVNGDFFVFTGGLGGEPDVYYEPTIYTVANPALNFSKNLVIGEDGILIRNDSMGVGLLPMFQKYASLLSENEITLRLADINHRIMFMLSAADDRTKESAEKFLRDVTAGKPGVISDNAFLESLKVIPTATQSALRLTDIIETEQYLRAGWFNDLGINANYNMKRESISPDEAQLNDDALLPLIDNMLEMRRIGIEQVNEKYGLDIKVHLASSWLKEQIEQLTPGVNFDSDNDEHINEQATSEEITEDDTVLEAPEEVTEDVEEMTGKTEEPENETEEPEEKTEKPEEPGEITESLVDIKKDLQEVKEEIEEIKESEENEGGEEDE